MPSIRNKVILCKLLQRSEIKSLQNIWAAVTVSQQKRHLIKPLHNHRKAFKFLKNLLYIIENIFLFLKMARSA